MILRRANPADAIDVWRWRNDPVTRAMSRSQGETTRESHLAWFDAALADFRRTLLIGEVEGQGFAQVAGGLELGRINVAARGLGVATASLHDAVAYAQQRKTFGKPICEHQAIQLKLGEMATRARAARLLTDSLGPRARPYAGQHLDIAETRAALRA